MRHGGGACRTCIQKHLLAAIGSRRKQKWQTQYHISELFIVLGHKPIPCWFILCNFSDVLRVLTPNKIVVLGNYTSVIVLAVYFTI